MRIGGSSDRPGGQGRPLLIGFTRSRQQDQGGGPGTSPTRLRPPSQVAQGFGFAETVTQAAVQSNASPRFAAEVE
jgi:hypothetical protein